VAHFRGKLSKRPFVVIVSPYSTATAACATDQGGGKRHREAAGVIAAVLKRSGNDLCRWAIHRLNESLRISLICLGRDGTERWITPRLTAFYRVQVAARPCASCKQSGSTAFSANCKPSSAGRVGSQSPQSKCCCNFQSYCQPDSSRLIWVTLLRPRTESIKQDVLISSGWLFLARSYEVHRSADGFLAEDGPRGMSLLKYYLST
jgi:hypothetical protein